jgi:hypothetical protein
MADEKAVKLFEEMLQKTRLGRIRWEPTADAARFVVAIGGRFTVLISKSQRDGPYGAGRDIYELELKDDQDRTLVEVDNDTDGVSLADLSELYDLARRHGLRVDEKLDRILGELSKL